MRSYTINSIIEKALAEVRPEDEIVYSKGSIIDELIMERFFCLARILNHNIHFRKI